jgi:hypothetical protein
VKGISYRKEVFVVFEKHLKLYFAVSHSVKLLENQPDSWKMQVLLTSNFSEVIRTNGFASSSSWMIDLGDCFILTYEYGSGGIK